MSTPERAKTPDSAPVREEAPRTQPIPGAPPGALAFVPVEAKLLNDLRKLQDNLEDYVEGLIHTGDSLSRCERLADFLEAKREAADDDLYWQGARNTLRDMSRLRHRLSANLIGLLGQDGSFIDVFDAALSDANGKVRTANNRFQAAQRQRIAPELLDHVNNMQEAAYELAELCRAASRDLSEQARRVVDKILARFEVAPDERDYAEPQHEAPKTPPVDERGRSVDAKETQGAFATTQKVRDEAQTHTGGGRPDQAYVGDDFQAHALDENRRLNP